MEGTLPPRLPARAPFPAVLPPTLRACAGSAWAGPPSAASASLSFNEGPRGAARGTPRPVSRAPPGPRALLSLTDTGFEFDQSRFSVLDLL